MTFSSSIFDLWKTLVRLSIVKLSKISDETNQTQSKSWRHCFHLWLIENRKWIRRISFSQFELRFLVQRGERVKIDFLLHSTRAKHSDAFVCERSVIFKNARKRIRQGHRTHFHNDTLRSFFFSWKTLTMNDWQFLIHIFPSDRRTFRFSSQ